MFTATLELKHFIKSTCVCPQNTNFIELLELIKTNSYEYVVAVDRDRSPLGAISTKNLIVHLLANYFQASRRVSPSSSLSWQQLNWPIEPIIHLSSEMNAEEFLALGQTETEFLKDNRLYGLFNPQGIFLGLLDPIKLLDAWLEERRDFFSRNSKSVNLEPYIDRNLAKAPYCLKDRGYSNNLNLVKTSSKITLESPLYLVLANEMREQQKIAKELIAKNADLLRLNNLKDEFLSSLGHELKSPLTAIVGLSSLLQEKKLGELNDRQSRYIELVYQSGRKLMVLVNDLLDLTNLETGRLKLTKEKIDIASLCDRAYQKIKLTSALTEKDEFTLEIETGLQNVIADEIRLLQMLVHLLDNACKFTRSQRKITLNVNLWERWIAFTVADNGIGIPEDLQHIVFQQFHKLENSFTNQFEGTGLGLLLTKQLAKAHGGEVSFISKSDRGNEFTLLLPLDNDRETNEILSERLVLIVESAASAIEDLSDKIKSLGYFPLIARTGLEALEKARQFKPKLIFIAPLLALLSGWDVVTLLKSDLQTAKITTIAIAANIDEGEAKSHGADGCLQLPAESEYLQTLLPSSKALRSRSKSLRILHLYPESEKGLKNISQFAQALNNFLSSFNHRILETDNLEQAELLARIWKIDAIILDGRLLQQPLEYLSILSQSIYLAHLPIITLDAKTTTAANQIENLVVFPYLVPDSEQNLEDLLEVIQIAANGQKKDFLLPT